MFPLPLTTCRSQPVTKVKASTFTTCKDAR